MIDHLDTEDVDENANPTHGRSVNSLIFHETKKLPYLELMKRIVPGMTLTIIEWKDYDGSFWLVIDLGP